MLSDSDRSQGAEEGLGGEKRDKRRGLFFSAALRGLLFAMEAGRLIGNERGQPAGSAEVNS